MVHPNGLWRDCATIADDRQCLNGSLGWLRWNVTAVKTRASIPLDAISDRGTPVWKLEATLKCRSCKRGR